MTVAAGELEGPEQQLLQRLAHRHDENGPGRKYGGHGQRPASVTIRRDASEEVFAYLLVGGHGCGHLCTYSYGSYTELSSPLSATMP